jgi:DNA-binding transcriptional ArsR family regulator
MAAPKNPKSLKSRIDALFDALGLEESDRPSTGEIRSQLSQFAVLAEKLENSQAAAEKEAIIAALETEFSNLKVELEAAKTAIDGFEAERKKQEEKEREIPPIQFEILKCLPSEYGGIRLRMDEIAAAVNIPVDETEIHVERLRRAGLVGPQENEILGDFWYRSKDGNELVFAKRLAGEEEQKKQYKYADLPQIQQEALRQLADGELTEREIARLLDKKLRLVRYHLHSLREAEMATDAEENPGSTVLGFSDTDEKGEEPYSPMWRILSDGEAYLAERELL